ncbi:MAG: S9 family peptidase [Acidobacteria bacterium]|nr:S9 family peptidase [Acidobacteriota bacterium]
MKIFGLILATAFVFHAPVQAAAQQKANLKIEAIFGGSLQEPVPSEMRWAPDGSRIAYLLEDENDEGDLWILDLPTAERSRAVSSAHIREIAPPPDQTGIGERERERRKRYGIPSYLWSPDGKHILLVDTGRLYLYDLAAQKAALLVPSKRNLCDPQYSPDGKWISFIHEHDIWIIPAGGGKERQITFGGNRLLLHGEPDWIYQEEFNMSSGYCWSPDSRSIAFIELDERSVPVYPMIEYTSGEAKVDWQAYPKAGDPNPKARIGIVNVKTRKTVWIERTAEYVARFTWADGDTVVLQLLNREQSELNLVEADSGNGRSKSLLIEKDAWWIDVGDDLAFLSGNHEFLWTSDRSGFRHIYSYNRSGSLIRQITAGDWVVSDIVGVDEQNGWIYYRSNQASILGLDLFRIKMDGSGAERMTKESGTHSVNMNPSCTAFVDSFSSMIRPREIYVRDLVGGNIIELFKSRSASAFDLVEPEMKELTARDGAAVRLLLYKPREMQPGRKYPLVVYVYGMPGVPTIQDAWAGNRLLYHQFLVQQGFLVAQIDDRSSSLPGHKYAVTAHRSVGPTAAQDHELAIQYLKTLPFVDGEAMAVWGWSGGGSLAAYHLTHTRLFKAGIAVAPVTDWRLYDSIYTERYMGMPEKESDAYDRASSVKAAADYHGHLLLVHGTQDDNVHPQNTIHLVQALIRNNKHFDLMLYPDKTHSIDGAEENVHLYSMMYEFLERNLRGK